MAWIAYLSGEIHTDWRQQIIDGVQAIASIKLRYLSWSRRVRVLSSKKVSWRA